MRKEEEISFVARHYRQGHFSINKGWKRLGLEKTSIWRRYRVAAAVAGTIFLSATAMVIYHQFTAVDASLDNPVIREQTIPNKLVVKTIDFENASLPIVIARIEEVYGVRLVNIPENAGEYTLSLHYEGNAVDLVETINEILDLQMSVEE